MLCWLAGFFSWLAGWLVADSGRAGWTLGRVLVGWLREDCLAALAGGRVCQAVCFGLGLGFGLWAWPRLASFFVVWRSGWHLWIVSLSFFLAGGWRCWWLGVLFSGRVALLVSRLYAAVRTFAGWLCEWVLWVWVGGCVGGFVCGTLVWHVVAQVCVWVPGLSRLA